MKNGTQGIKYGYHLCTEVAQASPKRSVLVCRRVRNGGVVTASKAYKLTTQGWADNNGQPLAPARPDYYPLHPNAEPAVLSPGFYAIMNFEDWFSDAAYFEVTPSGKMVDHTVPHVPTFDEVGFWEQPHASKKE